MKNICTRTLQDILRTEQIRLVQTTNPLMRGVIMRRISTIATELLYRWRKESQILAT
jgi:hypothetical protein